MLNKLKIKIFLLLFNPIIKVIIILMFWIILQLIFNPITEISKDVVTTMNESIQVLPALKQIIFKEIFLYITTAEAKEYYGALNTQIGQNNYKLITSFYTEFIINEFHIRKFLDNNINWQEIENIYGNDIKAIRENIIQEYIVYIDILEIEYNKKLLSVENIDKYQKEIAAYLITHFTNLITISPFKIEPVMLQHYIDTYINKIDLVSYIKSIDFKYGNMQLLIACCKKEVINTSAYNFSCFIYQIYKYFDTHLQLEIGVVSSEEFISYHYNTIREIIEVYNKVYIPEEVLLTDNNPFSIQSPFPLYTEYNIITPAVIQNYHEEERLFYYNQQREIKRLLVKLINIKIEKEANITIHFSICACFKITLKFIY